MKVARLIVAIIVVTCLAASAFAQAGRGGRMYNPSTETTVKGKVEKVSEITGKRGWNGTHLSLKADSATYDVHVGPSDYISSNGFTFKEGDQIEVTGSKIGSDTIIARQINMGGKTLTLRDSQGIPKWSGRGRRSGTP